MTTDITNADSSQSTRTVGILANEIQSRELFRFGREIFIRHEGELYRLRLTSRNKLILTK